VKLRHLGWVLAAVLLWAPPAAAVTPEEAAVAARDTGVSIDPGLDVDREAISAAVARAGNAGVRLFVVLLEDDPSGGATTFADAVLDRIGSGTVLVLSDAAEGAASTDFGRDALERALDAGFEAGGGDAGYVEAFAASLTGGGGGGGFGWVILLAVVGGFVLLVVWAMRRGRKSSAAARERAIAEARAEIRSQIDAMANQILEITDRVKLSPSDEDNTHLEAATATFAEASDRFEQAADLAALEALSDRLDEARWQLDAAEAIADGRPPPDRPAPEGRHACFFDPTHPGPFEDAEITTASGKRIVKVCGPDAARLREGGDPEPRMIEVGGRGVPAPVAPRSHGGGGLDVGDLLSVAVGGAVGRSILWGSAGRRGGSSRSRTTRRSGGSTASGSRSRAGRTRRRRR
jgi:hypothetical protein